MDALDEKAPRQFPPLPRAQLDAFTLLPMVTATGQVVMGSWLLPGKGTPITTAELEAIAAKRGTNLTIFYKE